MRDSKVHHRSKNCFFDLSRDINRRIRGSQDFHSDKNYFVDLSRHIKQAYTSFTGPPQRCKLLSPSFPAHKQACTNFTRLPQRQKPLCRSFQTHKQAYASFTGPHRGENCFLGLSRHIHRPIQASRDLQ